jgi:hypothetical protein
MAHDRRDSGTVYPCRPPPCPCSACRYWCMMLRRAAVGGAVLGQRVVLGALVQLCQRLCKGWCGRARRPQNHAYIGYIHRSDKSARARGSLSYKNSIHSLYFSGPTFFCAEQVYGTVPCWGGTLKRTRLKAFQPLVEYPVFLYRGFTIGDFTKCHSTPQKRPPHRCLGRLELQIGNSVRLGQSYRGKN